MIHPRIFRQAFLVAFGVQIVLTLCGYFFAFQPASALFLCRIVAAAIGGCLYGLDYEGGVTPSAFGGAIVGGSSIFPAVALSVSMGVDLGSMIPMATGACMLSGSLGGALGVWMAGFRR
jgi:hypothetical protein